MPVRIQRKRTKGWRAPAGAVNCTRPGNFGNPFKIGHWYRIGHAGFGWIECGDPADAKRTGFTLIKDAQMAVEWFREYLRRYPPSKEKLDELRGKDLLCWCGLDQPWCHVDVWLELANAAVGKARAETKEAANG